METVVTYGKTEGATICHSAPHLPANAGDFAATIDLGALDGTDGFVLTGIDDILIGAYAA